MDLRMGNPASTGWESLWTCDSMPIVQRILAADRQTAKVATDSGQARKARCLAEDSARSGACLEGLSALRDSVRRLVRAEDSLHAEVGRLASGCPETGWRRWTEYLAMEKSRDSVCRGVDNPDCGRILASLASVAWIPDRAKREPERHGLQDASAPANGLPLALAVLDRALDDSGQVPGRDTLLARSAFLLDRSGFADSARLRFQRLLETFPWSAWASSAHLYLGRSSGQAQARLDHLRAARDDSMLAPTALATQIDLLDSTGHPLEAADSLVSLLRLRPDRADSRTLTRLATLAQGVVDPDEFQSRLAAGPAPWADTLYLIQAELELRSNRFNRALKMLASFQVRFPGSSLSANARELLADARRKDPGTIGSSPK
jgi:TolA-binding protein